MFNILNLLSSLKGGNRANFQNIMNSMTNNNFANMPNYTYNNNPQNSQTMQQKNLDNQLGYPYGEFPKQYTKAGQEELKEKIKKGMYNGYNPYPQNHYNDFNALNNIYPNSTYTMQNENNNQQQHQHNRPGLDFNALMPLLQNIFPNNSSEMIKNLLPILSNRGNLTPNDILNLLQRNVKKSDESTQKNIDDYKKVE